MKMDGGIDRNTGDARNVRCDSCRCAFKPEPEILREDALEYTYFACPYCGRRHVVSVTDTVLRRRIRVHSLLAERNRKKRLPERTLRRMQRERAENRRRSMELREAHPMDSTPVDTTVDRLSDMSAGAEGKEA